MVFGDDSLLNTIADQARTIAEQSSRIKDLSEEIALLRAGENADRCVICGAIIPEGVQVCVKCRTIAERGGVIREGVDS